MSTAANPFWSTDTDPACTAAVQYGVALIGVLKGFTLRAFALGRVTRDVVARLKSEGVDHFSPKCGFDISGAVAVLRRALLMGDALRARLRTPAVAFAMMRNRSPSCGGGRGEGKVREQSLADPFIQIGWRRTNANTRMVFRDLIADMSDRQVVERICTDLMSAAEVLRDTREGARIDVLIHRAAMLLVPEMREAAPDAASPDATATPRRAEGSRAEGSMADAASDATKAAAAQPAPREVGRGPP